MAILLVAATLSLSVGSKRFTEGVILGEIAAQSCGAEHRRELGGTTVVWHALLAGEIHAYAEYTGTLSAELVRGTEPSDIPGLRRALAARGIAMTEPLGFANTYAIGVRRTLGITRLSQLGEVTLGLSHEFMERADGWPGLKQHYGLRPREVKGMDHDLAYRALQAGSIQATDLYTTDAEIAQFDLQVLEDDRRYFPDYRAVFLYRSDVPAECARALDALAGKVDTRSMIKMNARVKLDRAAEAQVAADFLGSGVTVKADSRAARILQRTKEHLALVLASLLVSIPVGIPLGILAAQRKRLRSLVLGLAGILQTIPSLALLVLLIPLLGIGTAPAAAALFLYALLPIVEGTVTGIAGVSPALRESAEALGLPPGARLRLVEMPLALPSILSGVRVAAVIAVGTATIGALVGAGGYGQPILTGIRLDSASIILEGAIPAAVMALVLQGIFALIERRFRP
jgi:osmoprotectant transport system permease protein